MLTHRLTGYLTVGSGVISVISGLLLSGTEVAAAPLLSLLAGAAIVAAYYLRMSRA